MVLRLGKGIVHLRQRFYPANDIKIALKLSKRMTWVLALIWLHLALIQSENSKLDLGQLLMID